MKTFLYLNQGKVLWLSHRWALFLKAGLLIERNIQQKAGCWCAHRVSFLQHTAVLPLSSLLFFGPHHTQRVPQAFEPLFVTNTQSSPSWEEMDCGASWWASPLRKATSPGRHSQLSQLSFSRTAPAGDLMGSSPFKTLSTFLWQYAFLSYALLCNVT